MKESKGGGIVNPVAESTRGWWNSGMQWDNIEYKME
jgi:hypothetical protein